MGHAAKAIANAMLDVAREHGASVTPLKLQKLVYIAHGWSLGLTGQPLVTDQLPEAWQYGPVFPSLYHEFKEFGKDPITSKANDFNIGNGFSYDVVEPVVPEEDTYTWSLLRRVWDQYGKYGGIALSELTHRSGTPWEQVWSKSGGVKNAVIPEEIVKAHYEALRAKNTAQRKQDSAS